MPLLTELGATKTPVSNLRVKDIDFEMNQITVRDGKGAKERTTLSPESLREPLSSPIFKLSGVFKSSEFALQRVAAGEARRKAN